MQTKCMQFCTKLKSAFNDTETRPEELCQTRRQNVYTIW